MAMTGGCEAWPPHDHGSRPDKRSGIRMDQHSNVLALRQACCFRISASIFKTLPRWYGIFSSCDTPDFSGLRRFALFAFDVMLVLGCQGFATEITVLRESA